MPLYHHYKNTSWEEKVRFALLWHNGFSVRAISKMARRSPTTVRKWVQRLQGTPLSLHSAADISVTTHNLDLLVLANLLNQGYAVPCSSLRFCMCGCQYYEGRAVCEGWPTGHQQAVPPVLYYVWNIVTGHSVSTSFPSLSRERPNGSHLLLCKEKS